MSDRPNILFFFPDQHRGDWIGAEGTPGVVTPNIDALIATGRHFTNALTPSPLCSPARGCMASARRYDSQGIKTNRDDFNPQDWNIYRAMRDAGYSVMGCGKFDLLKDSMDWGHDGMHGIGDDSRARQLGFTEGCDSAGKWDCITAYKRGKGPEPYRDYLQSLGLWQSHVQDFEAPCWRGCVYQCCADTAPRSCLLRQLDRQQRGASAVRSTKRQALVSTGELQWPP